MDGQGVGALGEGVLTAVDAPVHEDVVGEAFLAAVTDPGVGATAWADDGGAVPGTGDFCGILGCGRAIRRCRIG
jgi:hypothetical protein